MTRVLGNSPEMWRITYLAEIARWFAKLEIGTEFAGEDFRTYLEPLIGPPHHPNAWGACAGSAIRQWMAQKRICEWGIRESRSTKNHAHVYRQYRKVG